jgi:hypothetical protein
LDTPRLHLSYGQVAWTLSLGAPPAARLLDQLNYLRQLGIPFAGDERPAGSGNRRRYGYYELVECGVGLHAIRHGMKPIDFTQLLVGKRNLMRHSYRRAVKDQPEAALRAPWIKTHGKEMPVIEGEIWLRLHDRYAEQPGKIDVLGLNDLDAPEGTGVLDWVERYPGERTRGLVPLTRLVLQWTAWALEAPETRTGPRT